MQTTKNLKVKHISSLTKHFLLYEPPKMLQLSLPTLLLKILPEPPKNHLISCCLSLYMMPPPGRWRFFFFPRGAGLGARPLIAVFGMSAATKQNGKLIDSREGEGCHRLSWIWVGRQPSGCRTKGHLPLPPPPSVPVWQPVDTPLKPPPPSRPPLPPDYPL